MKKKTSSQARTTTTCLRMLQMNPLPVLPTNCLSLHLPTMTRSHLLHNSLSMSRGKSSKKPPSATRRNHSLPHHTLGSMSSATANVPSRTRLRLLRDSQPQSRTGRVSTTSVSYSSRSRLPGSENGVMTAPTTMTTLTMTTLTLQWPQLGSPSMPGTSRMPPSQSDEMLASWPNGSNASPTGELYSTPRTTGLGINPMPLNYSPPLTSPTRPLPRASLDGSSMPSLAPQLPSTPSAQLPMPPLTGAYTWSSSTTESSTRRPRLSTIASATLRQRYREWWRTSSLPLDDSREPEPQLAWDMSNSEPEALGRLEGWDGNIPENDG